MKRKMLVVVPAVILTLVLGSVAVNACHIGSFSKGLKGNFFSDFSNKSSFNSNVQNNCDINSKANINIDVNAQIEQMKKQFESFKNKNNVNNKCDVDVKVNVNGKTARIVSNTTVTRKGNSKVDVTIDGKKVDIKKVEIVNPAKDGANVTPVKAATVSKDGDVAPQVVTAKEPETKVDAVATSADSTVKADTTTVDNTVKAEPTTVDNTVKAEPTTVDNTVKADSESAEDLPKAGESSPFSYLLIGIALVGIGIAVLNFRKRATHSSWNR